MPTLFDPLEISPAIKLQHRIVLAPMTRCRGTVSESDSRQYLANDLMIKYYVERAGTPGTLMISEALPTSLRGSAMPGCPGITSDEQVEAWSKVVKAVHEKDCPFVGQLWDTGRVNLKMHSGMQPWSSSAVKIQGPPLAGKEHDEPHAMTVDEIAQVHDEYVLCAKNCIKAGMDGVEVHAANGYMPDQFQHSNINLRTDDYGGDYKKRCRFTLELAKKLCDAVGRERVAVRLAPYGAFNETRGEEREIQWLYLCTELAKLGIAYIHLVEPRFDEFQSEETKLKSLAESGGMPTLRPFCEAIRATDASVKIISAGGFTYDNAAQCVENGDYDAVAFGRYFTSNPDLVQRVKNGQRFYRYVRPRFYGPFPDDQALCYTDWEPKYQRVFADETDRGKAQLVG